MDLRSLAKLIASKQWKALTQQYRALPNSAPKGKFKTSRFDFSTFSGIFSQRNNYSLNSYSGLLVLDIDNIGDVDKTKDNLFNQSHFDIAMLYISPSGNGLKVVVPSTTEDEHQLVYQMYQNVLKEELGIEIDASGKDLARSCFLCWDPEVYYNPDFRFRKIERYWSLPEPASVLNHSSLTQNFNCSSDTDMTPISDFNKRGDIGAMLLEHKWSKHSKVGDRIFYCRPGKSKYEGQSGNVLLSINYLYVFTTASSFEANRGYTASEVFAVIKCEGDMQMASERLKAMGYGY